MFDQFPKTRPKLSKDLEQIYYTHHKSNRQGDTTASSISQRMESWLHKQVARDLLVDHDDRATLEIGAGTLNQLKYEPASGSYDIVEPCQQLYLGSPSLQRIRNIYSDMSEIPADRKYQRITSVATFEHICNLPEVIALCGLHLTPDGIVRISIPSEGTLLWKLGWKLTTGIEFRLKYGLNYSELMKYEHVNTAAEIEELLRYFFKIVDCRVFGLTTSISFYQFYACRIPIIERCNLFSRG